MDNAGGGNEMDHRGTEGADLHGKEEKLDRKQKSQSRRHGRTDEACTVGERVFLYSLCGTMEILAVECCIRKLACKLKS
jgi:hypothetical protein